MTTPSSTSLRAFDQLATAKRQQRGTPVPSISLSQIAPLAGQPRQSFDQAALNDLAESIKAHGVIQPIILINRKNVSETDVLRYGIVCGERRFHAARLAGLDTIPALVRDYEEDEVALLALLENLQREDLTPLEEGEYLVQLKQKYGFTEEQLGERLGKSRDYVHMRTRLLNLKPDVLAAWRNPELPGVFERLTPSHAILVNQIADEGLRQGLLASVVGDGLTVADTRKRLEQLKRLNGEAETLPADTIQSLKQAVVAGLSENELALKLGSAKKRLEPGTPTADPNHPGPRLALADLELYKLLAPLIKSGQTEIGLRELEQALKLDTAWVKRIAKDGLANG